MNIMAWMHTQLLLMMLNKISSIIFFDESISDDSADHESISYGKAAIPYHTRLQS